MVDPDVIKIVSSMVVAEAVTASFGFRGLSKKDRKMLNDEEKIQKWKNKMRKFDKI